MRLPYLGIPYLQYIFESEDEDERHSCEAKSNLSAFTGQISVILFRHRTLRMRRLKLVGNSP